MRDWLKKTMSQLTEAIAKNLGTAIAAFVMSGGYLIAIAKLSDFQAWVRKIPTDYVLTPLVLVLVVLAAVARVTLRQRRELHSILSKPQTDDDESRMVTHYGVWWKLYPDAQYMEDFPYCSCCTPPKKLVQTEWHPEEKFKCSATGTEYQLFDGIPWELEKARSSLYEAYFKGQWLFDHFHREHRRVTTLWPDLPDDEVLLKIVGMEPFSKLPADELNPLLARFKKPFEFIHFVQRNMHHYRQFLAPKRKRRSGDA